MKPFIQATVQDIQDKIQSLVELRDRLLIFSHGEQPAMVEPTQPPPHFGEVHFAKATKPKAKPAKADAQKPVRGNLAEIATSIGKKLPPIFASADIQEVLGCDWKKASNLITRFKAKGWIVAESLGRYQRTKSFGGVSGQSATILAEIHKDIDATKGEE